jgi:hypothetical protein
MKKLILLLLFIPLVGFGQSFYSGYQAGFKKGYCMDDIACTPPISSIPSIPKIGEGNSYSDGYARGVVEGRAKRNNSSSSGSGAYENPQYIKPVDFTIANNAFQESFNANMKGWANAFQAEARVSEQFSKFPKKSLNSVNNLNRYRVVYLSESVPLYKNIIKSYNKNKSNLPLFVSDNTPIVVNSGGLENFVKKYNSTVLFGWAYAAMGGNGHVNLQLYDINETLVYSKWFKGLTFSGAVNKLFKDLAKNGGQPFKYDSSLGLLPSTKKEIITKSKVNLDKKIKDDAVDELKKLKELLDLELITQEEFDKKSKELKKIILN